MIKLYGAQDWSSIEWKQRQALKGKPLALWLHGFYSSHAYPFQLKTDTLRQLSGSRTQEKRRFKAALKKAFAELEKAAGYKATFDGDLVTVERPLTPSQILHARKKRAPKKA